MPTTQLSKEDREYYLSRMKQGGEESSKLFKTILETYSLKDILKNNFVINCLSLSKNLEIFDLFLLKYPEYCSETELDLSGKKFRSDLLQEARNIDSKLADKIKQKNYNILKNAKLTTSSKNRIQHLKAWKQRPSGIIDQAENEIFHKVARSFEYLSKYKLPKKTLFVRIYINNRALMQKVCSSTLAKLYLSDILLAEAEKQTNLCTKLDLMPRNEQLKLLESDPENVLEALIKMYNQYIPDELILKAIELNPEFAHRLKYEIQGNPKKSNILAILNNMQNTK